MWPEFRVHKACLSELISKEHRQCFQDSLRFFFSLRIEIFGFQHYLDLLFQEIQSVL